MWPLRAERLTDLIPVDELRLLLSAGAGGSAMTFCEAAGEDGLRSVTADARFEMERPDPFCSYFRHGEVAGTAAANSKARPAFEGADAACARCEEKMARQFLTAPGKEGCVGRRRCHMGLTDSCALVQVAGQAVGGLIAGRRVASEEDRRRIRKSVGKLGKLTKAERARFDSREHLVIRPHDDAARDRLAREIDAVPLCSDELDAALVERADLLAHLAEERFQEFRRRREDALLVPVRQQPQAWPRTQGQILAELERHLRGLRGALGLRFVALFARPLEAIGSAEAPLYLLVESGLEVPVGMRVVEMDFSRLPGAPAGERSEVTRGLEAVSALIGALTATAEAPEGLKGALTKSQFLAPVEVSSTWQAAVAFGAPESEIEPADDDYGFFCRLARCLAERYYSFCGVAAHAALSVRVAAAERELDALKAERLKAERLKAETPPGQRFDLRKLSMECQEELRSAADAKSLSFDNREVAERLVIVGDRRRIGAALRRLISIGVERSSSDSEDGPLSPLRLVLKRRGPNALIVIEAIGRFLSKGEERRLFRRPPRSVVAAAAGTDGGPEDGGSSPPAGPSGGTRQAANAPLSAAVGAPSAIENVGAEVVAGLAPAAETGLLREVRDVVQSHRGRLRVRSERLHRFASDETRWLGKTTFEVELPLPPRLKKGRSAPRAAD